MNKIIKTTYTPAPSHEAWLTVGGWHFLVVLLPYLFTGLIIVLYGASSLFVKYSIVLLSTNMFFVCNCLADSGHLAYKYLQFQCFRGKGGIEHYDKALGGSLRKHVVRETTHAGFSTRGRQACKAVRDHSFVRKGTSKHPATLPGNTFFPPICKTGMYQCNNAKTLVKAFHVKNNTCSKNEEVLTVSL